MGFAPWESLQCNGRGPVGRKQHLGGGGEHRALVRAPLYAGDGLRVVAEGGYVAVEGAQVPHPQRLVVAARREHERRQPVPRHHVHIGRVRVDRELRLGTVSRVEDADLLHGMRWGWQEAGGKQGL